MFSVRWIWKVGKLVKGDKVPFLTLERCLKFWNVPEQIGIRLKKAFPALSFITSENPSPSETTLMSGDGNIEFSSASVMSLFTRTDIRLL